MVLAVGAYLGKFMPPAEFAPEKFTLMTHALLKSHIHAYEVLHSEIPTRTGPWKHLPIQVGIAHNVLDFLPERAWHPIERLCALALHRFYNQSWLNAVCGRKQHFGILGLVPKAQPVREALGRNTVDFIGINYYTKAYIQWRPKDISSESPVELPLGIAFARKKELASDLGWAIHPLGFRKLLHMASQYQLPIYITENGIADREDQHRSHYLMTHVAEIARAIQQGIDIRGYYHWSLLDNFEWIKGFWPRFGLFHVDYSSFERKWTQSAQLYQKMIHDHLKKKNKGSYHTAPQVDYFTQYLR
jgi:beta-glucosidase